MILLHDNYDSFTYNLKDYLLQCGASCQVVKNDMPIDEIDFDHVSGIVLSPGPETPNKAGTLMALIDKYHDKYPILGVCLGHQALGQYFGHALVKAVRPMHGKISRLKILKPEPLFVNIPTSFNVVRYNSLLIDSQINTPLKVTAISDKGEIMAFQHRHLPLYGLQFHPEAVLTEYGIQMVKNWLDYNNLTQ